MTQTLPRLLDKPSLFQGDLSPIVTHSDSPTKYQGPSSGVAMMEMQRIRSTVIGNIQQSIGDQDRRAQQAETQMNIVQRELVPKMQNLERHNSFNKQQLGDIIERLSMMENESIPAIKQKNDEIQMKLQQCVRSESVTKIKPLLDDIRHERNKFDQLTDKSIAEISEANQKLKNLLRMYDKMLYKSDDLTSFVQDHLDLIAPRLDTFEHQLKAFEVAHKSAVKNQNSHSEMIEDAKKLRKKLEEIETQIIPNYVKSHASDSLTDITTISNEIEQKFNAVRMAVSNVDNSVNVANEQQRTINSQLDEISKSANDTQNNIDSEETDINERLSRIEELLNNVNQEITNELNDFQAEGTSKNVIQIPELDEEIELIQNASREILGNLKEDWNLFNNNNSDLQDKINKEVEDIFNVLNGKIKFIQRVTQAEKRVKWCVDRLNVWAKEVELKKTLKVNEEVLSEKLAKLEEKLKDHESKLHNLDHKDAPQPYEPPTEFPQREERPCPAPVMSKHDLLPKSIPKNIQLTYENDDFNWILPQRKK